MQVKAESSLFMHKGPGMDQSERVKIARSDLGLTTRAMAADLGIGASVISDWENGRAPVRQPNAMAIQLLYGIRWQWLMTGEGEMWVGSVNEAPSTQARAGVDVPVFTSIPETVWDGSVLVPEPCERFTFSASALQSAIKVSGGGFADTFYFLRAPHEGFGIQKGDLVLINSAAPLRRSPANVQLHLARPGIHEPPVIRRVFVTPNPAMLSLVGPDGSALALAMGKAPLEQLVLGRVCTWIHQEAG